MQEPPGDSGNEKGAPGAAAAVVAFLLLVTGALLPWWQLAWTSGEGTRYDRVTVGLFSDEAGVTHAWARITTLLLLAAAALPLFLRVAGREWRYSAPTWRRTLAGSTACLALALVSGWMWSDDAGGFWSTTRYDAAGVAFEQANNPALGWWFAAAALVLLGFAWLQARPSAG